MQEKNNLHSELQTPQEYVKNHEGLWHMLGGITYKIGATWVKVFENDKYIKTEYRLRKADGK